MKLDGGTAESLISQSMSEKIPLQSVDLELVMSHLRAKMAGRENDRQHTKIANAINGTLRLALGTWLTLIDGA